MIDSTELATDRLINQFACGSDQIEAMTNAGMTKVDVIAGIAALAVGTLFEDAKAQGVEAEGLSVWHQSLRQRCTASFEELAAAHPELSKKQINELDNMVILNGIRRGVKRAMAVSYERANTRKIKARRPAQWVD